jgi:hypothetical protein
MRGTFALQKQRVSPLFRCSSNIEEICSPSAKWSRATLPLFSSSMLWKYRSVFLHHRSSSRAPDRLLALPSSLLLSPWANDRPRSWALEGFLLGPGLLRAVEPSWAEPSKLMLDCRCGGAVTTPRPPSSPAPTSSGSEVRPAR